MSELRAVGGPRRNYRACILYAAGRCWPPLLPLACTPPSGLRGRQGCRGLLAIGGALLAANNLLAHRSSAACQRRLSIDGVIARLARGCARGRPLAHLASDNLLARQLSAA